MSSSNSNGAMQKYGGGLTEAGFPEIDYGAVERALLMDDVSGLNDKERLQYYHAVCQSLGLNPLTKPFAYMNFQGKTVMYAKKDATDQLRKICTVSYAHVSTEVIDDIVIVRGEFWTPDGRKDQAIGAVDIKGLYGQALANAYMKAETKCKRRGTLSICGLGFLDESELEDDDPMIDSARKSVNPEALHGSVPVQIQGTQPQPVQAVEPERLATEEQKQRIEDILSLEVWTDKEREITRSSMNALTEEKAERWIEQMRAKAEARLSR